MTGVELFVSKKRSKALYMELGAMGTGADADQLVNSPVYANGFTITWGYKYYLETELNHVAGFHAQTRD